MYTSTHRQIGYASLQNELEGLSLFKARKILFCK